MTALVRDRAHVEAPAGMSTVRRLYWYAFVLRSAVGLLAWALSTFADATLVEDGLYYEDLGYTLASDWLAGYSIEWFSNLAYEGKTGWLIIVVIAAFYILTGGVRALPILLVLYSALTAVLPLYTYWITLELGASRRAAKQAAWLVVASPAFVFWSGSLYKEGLIFLALSLTVYHTLRLQRQWSTRSFVLVVASVFAMLGLRFYLAAIIGIVTAIGLFFARRTEPGRPLTDLVPALLRQTLIIGGFVAMMMAFGFIERAERPLFETERGFLVQLDVSRRDLATSYSGYLADRPIETVGDAIALMPVGLLYFLTVPHPWDPGSLRQALTVPETVFWVVVLYPLVLLGIRRGLRVNRSGTLVLLMLTAGMCMFYALLAANVGTAYRMRAQVWLLWAPFVAWGIEAYREWRHTRWTPNLAPGHPTSPRTWVP